MNLNFFHFGKMKVPENTKATPTEIKIDDEAGSTSDILANLDEGTYDEPTEKKETATVTDINKNAAKQEHVYDPEKYPKGMDIGENIIHHKEDEDIAA